MGALGVWLYQISTVHKAEKATPASTSQRRLAVTNAVTAGPQTQIWATPNGDVIELTIPSASLGGRLLEVKRCTVWRDRITSSSSMSCSEPTPDTLPSDPPEHQQ